MTKPWLCRIGRHRWQRLRNPEGGWYRECRGCRKQRVSSGGGQVPPVTERPVLIATVLSRYARRAR